MLYELLVCLLYFIIKMLKIRWVGSGVSLVAQWLRIHLPVQGTWVWVLVREDLTCRGATEPVRHYYWACTLEPMSHNYWSPHATTTEARAPRTCAPQQEKLPQWEAHAPQWTEKGNRNIHIDNFLKREWIKYSNQKTQSHWMDTKTRPIYMLSTRDPLQT